MDVERVKEQLINCVEEDNKNNKIKKPSTRKLDNLDLFVNHLLNKKYQDLFLDENILEIARKWLEPLPDKTLPNITIRKRLLETLKVLPVEKGHLISSVIGKIINFYSINPKESLEIKKLSLEIIQKWTRRVIDVSGE